ncbi:MAG: hypothetical protein OEV06_00940 [Anaerolineae bacterium]|nr:hypothetical protein [Anaerolineae bacterium]
MAINHTAPPMGKTTDRLKHAGKSPRKPGVSPEFIRSIVRNAEAQSVQDIKSSAS